MLSQINKRQLKQPQKMHERRLLIKPQMLKGRIQMQMLQDQKHQMRQMQYDNEYVYTYIICNWLGFNVTHKETKLDNLRHTEG